MLSVFIASPTERRAATRADTEVNFGFWLYLMSDVILFSMLFIVYIDLSSRTAGGPTGAELFHLREVFIETMALLFSSLTFGLAILGLQKGNRRQVIGWMIVTFILGACFIGLELSEFAGMMEEGASYTRSGFLSGFFILVGTHGTHVAIGLIWIAVMIGQVVIKGLTVPVASRLARLSLFWHFLDLVWIAVFSTVYLAGVTA